MAKEVLTPEEIARVAYDAGFKDRTTLSRAVAVALAESGGKIRVVNESGNSPASRDRGLWQINDYWHKEVSDAEAFNPPAAAKHVYRISNGGKSWSQWVTWTNGMAGAQMGRAALAAAKVTGNPGAVQIDNDWWDPLDILPDSDGGGGGDGPDVGGLTDALMFPLELVKYAGQVTEIMVKSAAWMMNPANWLRVLEVAAGAGVVILGVKMLASSGVGGPVGATARGAVKAGGAVVKQVKKAKTAAESAASMHPAGAAAMAAKNAGAAAKETAKGTAKAAASTAGSAVKTTATAAAKGVK
ncbi:hypothetical protein [Streptomyces sp. ISL-100]|uniref:hypothetical protein n=1 Tax=Streptomyces sp. ISL-100 TaxID=2819173 RepID=UPI001BED0E37|nr:hypothetical protein [Streptomyces sp. ISL-100]MBT2400643.1 hypothetical protein [Streptomyces sp. ISL-100]